MNNINMDEQHSTQTESNSNSMSDTANSFTQTDSKYVSARSYVTFKPRVMTFEENGTTESMLNKFLNKVKPIEGGIVIFNTPNWTTYPSNINEAKKLSKEWSIAFSKKPTHKNVTTNIYFDMLIKAITFKIKPYNITTVVISDKSFDNVKNEIRDNLKLFFETNNNSKILNTFNFQVSGCEDYPANDQFKEKSKEFALELEESLKEFMLNNYYVIVFMKNDRITITLKKKKAINVCNDVIIETKNTGNIENKE